MLVEGDADWPAMPVSSNGVASLRVFRPSRESLPKGVVERLLVGRLLKTTCPVANVGSEIDVVAVDGAALAGVDRCKSGMVKGLNAGFVLLDRRLDCGSSSVSTLTSPGSAARAWANNIETIAREVNA